MVEIPKYSKKSEDKKVTVLRVRGKIVDVREPVKDGKGIPITLAIDGIYWPRENEDAQKTFEPVELNKTPVEVDITVKDEYINFRNLKVVEDSAKDLRLETESSPLFIPFCKCPNCGEEMVWFKPELEKLHQRIERYGQELSKALKEVCKIFQIRIYE